MERIVLGYDGSPAAISALNWTAARSTRGMTKVDVVLVASPSTQDALRASSGSRRRKLLFGSGFRVSRSNCIGSTER